MYARNISTGGRLLAISVKEKKEIKEKDGIAGEVGPLASTYET